jgi:isoamylase
MADEAWNTGFIRCLGVRLAGDLIDELGEHGQKIAGDTLLILFNAHHEMIPFTLPNHADVRWELILDTVDPGKVVLFLPGVKIYQLQGRSIVVLKAPAAADTAEQPAHGVSK